MGYVNNNNSTLNINNKILGVDQSFSNTGLVIVEDNRIIYADSISTKNNISLEDRIIIICKHIINICKEYNVYQVCIEGLSYNSRFASARQLAGLFYVILNELKRNNIIYNIVEPKSLKKLSTGNGNANKELMINSISERNKLILSKLSNINVNSKKFEDISDAYHLSMYNYYTKSIM